MDETIAKAFYFYSQAKFLKRQATTFDGTMMELDRVFSSNKNAQVVSLLAQIYDGIAR